MTTSSPWHAGERAVQMRVGEQAIADQVSGGIHRTVPPVAADFLARQRLLVVSAADAAGRVWVTMLTGEPGFVRAPRPDVIVVDAVPAPADPLAPTLAGPTTVGTLAIEPASRRRVRINGRARPAPGGMHIDLDQAFSNCPKYIQQRELLDAPQRGTPGASGDTPSPATAREADDLAPDQQAWLTNADTFFIGTADERGNTDASHRGGNPGFVEALSGDRFRFPDYRGNSMYTTLGNLDQRADAGFLFVDWATGTTLHVTGTATVDYDARGAAEVPGALRMIDVRVSRTVEVTAGAPLAWGPATASRFNPPVRGGPPVPYARSTRA